MPLPWEEYAQQGATEGPWAEYQEPKKRYGTGKSFDVMEDGALVPSESVHYTGAGAVPASSGIAQREKKYGTQAGIDWSVKPENVQDVRRGVSPVARGGIKAVTALPTLAQDFGVAVRNQFPGQNYELPSESYEREVFDRYFPMPNVPLDRTVEFGTSLIGGMKMPNPEVAAANVPKGFKTADGRQALRDELLLRAQSEGYVVPPSANNPSASNRLLEGIAGKLKVGQQAIINNQPVTDRLAARALGQNADAPITQGSLQVIRNGAYKSGYEPVKSAGPIATDDAFLNKLIGVTQIADDAAKSFPGLKAASPIDGVIDSLLQNSFTAKDGVSAVQYIRGLADEAYGAGKGGLGKQYKAAATAIEDQIERGLSKGGNAGESLLTAFRDARALIAKTHTAGKALVDDAGSSNARTYASEMVKGKPLTGDQRLIGQFGSTFGKYTPKPTGENYPAISPLDVYGAAGVSAASGNPLPLMYPLTRTGLREYLLSPAGQARAFKKAPSMRPGLLGGMAVSEQELQGLIY